VAKFILRKAGEGVKEAGSRGVSPVSTRKMSVARIALGSPHIGTIVIRTQHHPVAHEVGEGLHSIHLSRWDDVVCAWLDRHQRCQSIAAGKSTTSAHGRSQSEHQPAGESTAVEPFR